MSQNSEQDHKSQEPITSESSPQTQPSAQFGVSLADAFAKQKLGIKLNEEEKAVYREAYKADKAPVTLDELEAAHDLVLRRLTKEARSFQAKDLPKVLEIFKTAITERKSKGERGDTEKAKEPTREEMLLALQGRRAKAAP